ncbi:MAG: alpha/beta fold hydrolase [Desulfobulbaceae bacterium]|nr:MAG: alpha/beta fold hydrolase [Desulfobulbaceae bacterium]
MNRSAYLTTGLAIRALSWLTKADVCLHGQENIPKTPTIFVVNHFTRLETLLLPYYIYTLTDLPVWSLAASDLFKGGLVKIFDLIGVVSTKDPQRDELIVKTLLTGEANWIIFPEGSMVKTKKIMHRGRYMITDPRGMRQPHTGAAALALRAEISRRYLLSKAGKSERDCRPMLDFLGIKSLAAIRKEGTAIVPVNLTYYPIRARENIVSTLASRLVDDLPERMLEEIMTEGTMLLSGVDLDIRFGKPINMQSYLREPALAVELQKQDGAHSFASVSLQAVTRKAAGDIMQKYMHDIYSMTTINHEHLFVSLLRLYPFSRIREADLRRRALYAASLLEDGAGGNCHLHKSLGSDQIHLVTDDRYRKVENFLQCALETGILRREGGVLVQDRSKLSAPLSLHRGRIENPLEIIANEAEPLGDLRRLLLSLAWQPDFLIRINLARYLLKKHKETYSADCRIHAKERDGNGSGRPFILPSWPGRPGVVLVHSYLAEPEEVRKLGRYLNRRGFWVYAPRLPGHATSPEDLAGRTSLEWLETVERAYALLDCLCPRVALGGVSVGAALALDLAARIKNVAAVFAICPPLRLQDFSARFMPAEDVWERLLRRVKGNSRVGQFLEFASDNPHINYSRNPVLGIRQVGRLLAGLEEKAPEISQPVLIVQAENNPVVNPRSARRLHAIIGSSKKELNILPSGRHILVNGEGSERVHHLVWDHLRKNL